MKRIIKKLTQVPNALLRRTRWYKTYSRYGIAKFYNLNDFNLEIVNLGSTSAVYDLSYNGIKGGMNWALEGQTLQYDYNILKNYFSYLKPGAVVLITLTPFNLFNATIDPKLNRRYYTILHPATILNFDENQRFAEYEFKYKPFRNRPLFVIVKILTSPFSFCQSNSKRYRLASQKDMSEVYEAKRQSDICAKNINLINEMISFCKERDLNPVVVMLPLSKTVNSQLDTHDDLQCRLTQESFDAPFLDFNSGKGLNAPTLYNSPTILNSEGSKAFMSKLYGELKRLGIVKA